MTKPPRAKSRRNYPNQTKKGTLDQKHTERIDRFEKMSSLLPTKKQKLRRLESELDDLSDMNPLKYTDQDVKRKVYLMNSIGKLREEINSIENCTESLNYIVQTLPILIDYYDNEDIIDDGMEEEIVNEPNETGKNNILSYFMRENNKEGVVESSTKSDKSIATTKSKKNVTKQSDSKTQRPAKQMSRAKLYDNYLNVTDCNYRKRRTTTSTVCSVPNCGGEKILSQNDSYMVCNKCGFSEIILLPTDKPSYKEPTQDSGTYAYKRINHLTEILSQLQAKESTDIPQRVFQSILTELKKRKIDKHDLDIFRLRRILKKLNYRKYYEHVPHILQIINGKEPPNFSRKDEMQIKKMFKQIQKPFAIYCPKNRKNFLNYSYVLHKFCELLDLDEYISYFPLLKNNAKLLQHDKIWKNICAYQKWEYIKSI